MGQNRPCALLCAALLLNAGLSVCRGQSDPPRSSKNGFLDSTLAVQVALQKGKQHNLDGNYTEAIKVLESQIARIDGDRHYLTALRDAYRGRIRQLRLAKRFDDMRLYLYRLEILQPGAAKELGEIVAQPKASPPLPAVPELKTTGKRKEPLTARARVDHNKPRKVLPVGKLVALPPPPVPDATAEEAPVPDPFHISNYKNLEKAKGLIARAEKLFSEKKYLEALVLYEEAHQAVPELLEKAQERWAYCKLYRVVHKLNEQDLSTPYSELEADVRTALEMTPRLSTFGNKLLVALANRKKGSPAKPDSSTEEVRHSQPAGSPWAIAQTDNFRVYHQGSKAAAERIARTAEKTRAEQQEKWFGKVEPQWKVPCLIYLYKTAEDYRRKTGISQQSPGHATIKRKGSQILSRRIDLRADFRDTIGTVLPHETTHIVLAGRFGPFDIPRWADEGIAVLSEPGARRQKFAQLLNQYRREGKLFRLSQLLRMEDWPSDPKDITLFYAQSHSVVEFLVQQKGEQTFARFLENGMTTSMASALRRFYGWQTFEEVEREWLSSAFPSSSTRR